MCDSAITSISSYPQAKEVNYRPRVRLIHTPNARLRCAIALLAANRLSRARPNARRIFFLGKLAAF